MQDHEPSDLRRLPCAGDYSMAEKGVPVGDMVEYRAYELGAEWRVLRYSGVLQQPAATLQSQRHASEDSGVMVMIRLPRIIARTTASQTLVCSKHVPALR